MKEEIISGGRKENYNWVRHDKSGKEFLCPSSVSDPKSLSREELESKCVDDLTASVNPRGG